MNYLECEYAATRGRTPRDEARRALLGTAIASVELADKILRKFTSPAAIDEVLDRAINPAAGARPQPWKELCEMEESVADLKELFADARRAEEKRREREAKRAAAKAAEEAAKAVKAKAKSAKARKERPKKTPIPKVIKDEIWDYYIGNSVATVPCPCCQKTPITMRDFVAGHVLAEKNGGTITCDNLVPICNKCNSSMGARHMVEFTQKHWGRPPVTPRNPVAGAASVTEDPWPLAVTAKKYTHHPHTRAITSGHVDAARFASDAEALAYATTKGYTAVTHKHGSAAMYYFTDKPCKKHKPAKSTDESAWDYDSWI